MWWLKAVRPWMFLRQDGTGGGGSETSTEESEGSGEASTEETGEGEGTEEAEGEGESEGTEEEGAEETGEAGEEGTGEETPEKPVKAEGKPPKGYVPLAALKEVRAELRQIKEGLKAEVEGVQTEVRNLKPQKDPIDALIESLPTNADPESEEGRLRADLQALAPALKKLRPALAPEVGQHRVVLRGALQLIDKLAFAVDQLTDSLGDKKPIGLKYMDRIEKARQEKMEKSGGRPPAYQSVFDELHDQLTAEEQAAADKEKGIRTDEQRRQTKQREERERAAGGPRGAASPPRGGPTTPRARTFAQIEKDRLAGKDYVVR